jgi:hypothetical protein
VRVATLLVANELLPDLFGTGANAKWDWSLIFVTLRFVVVPLLAISYIGANLWLAWKQGKLTRSAALRCACAVIFLVFSLLHDVT